MRCDLCGCDVPDGPISYHLDLKLNENNYKICIVCDSLFKDNISELLVDFCDGKTNISLIIDLLRDNDYFDSLGQRKTSVIEYLYKRLGAEKLVEMDQYMEKKC